MFDRVLNTPMINSLELFIVNYKSTGMTSIDAPLLFLLSTLNKRLLSI